MVSRVRRISLAFHDSPSLSGARLWVEPAAKTGPIRQTVTTAQNSARRKNLPATKPGHSVKPGSRGQTHIKPTEIKTLDTGGRKLLRREIQEGTNFGGKPGSPTVRPSTSLDLSKTVSVTGRKVNHSSRAGDKVNSRSVDFSPHESFTTIQCHVGTKVPTTQVGHPTRYADAIGEHLHVTGQPATGKPRKTQESRSRPGRLRRTSRRRPRTGCGANRAARRRPQPLRPVSSPRS